MLQRRNLIAFHWKKTIIRLCFCLQKTAIPCAYYIGNAWHFFVLKCYLRLFTILKTSKKDVWSNDFWYVKVYIFWKLMQYTIHWDKTQTLKKFPSDKINAAKTALFFFRELQLITVLLLIRRSTRFIFLRLCLGLSHFRFRFIFIAVYIFVQQKELTLLSLKRHNYFQNKNNRKAKQNFAPRPLIFKLQQKVWKLNGICVSWSSPKAYLEKKFLN